ncbi:Metallo-hydrolase/oxidoreductase superfamily protein [Zea mays]|uniref:Metallo-hydrolase/oxidoreductase superfamily protein n=1 Tax=Zea mays TaxID=4577 RepID=A0A1D6MLZ6_MAIZE|nr:Metallo-hydrolase/oxidoreductase superfamily protein [Zea mays]
MASPSYRLAAAITAPSTGEFLVVRQPRPPSPPEEEEDYRRFVDSDLYDLPSAPLGPLEGAPRSEVAIGGADSVASRLDLSRLDVSAALDQIFHQFGLPAGMSGEWRLLKYVEEAEFGPDAGINTVYIVGSLELRLDDLPESCKWMSKECALRLLSEAKPGNDRIGQYAYIGLLNSELSSNCTASPALPFQEYPPGITLVPMKSRTLAPFRTTNLVVVRSTNGAGGSTCSDFFASGEALLIDPGCSSQVHAELADLIDSLPKRLLVLVTHHHQDHIEGTWQIDYTSVTGGEKICIGDQELQVVFAPGHTDGHMGLLHVNTNTLVVGDHCVGHGSATLDSRNGGNMKDYFETTYKFLELSPHVLIPMHGRINLWPKYMLCGYLRNRRAREASILHSIENGAQTLFDIVSKTYSDVDRKLWIPASFNVRLHVDHLNSLHKLPKDFSLEMFSRSCDDFISRV